MYFYFSFASEKGFLGAVVVEAEDTESAIAEVNRRGLNPGGEALILPFPEGSEGTEGLPVNRLISREEIVDARRVGDLSEEEQSEIEGTRVCEECNEEARRKDARERF
jgi:hypothetical protein